MSDTSYSYHDRVMNIQATYTDSQDMAYENSEEAYRDGHRVARHVAAEIAIEAEREIEELKETIELLQESLCSEEKYSNHLENVIAGLEK